MDTNEKAIALHKEWNGKLETVAKTPVKTREDLAIAYTPGVAAPCKIIAEDKKEAYTYTMKANTVAVVSDGSAVLGLGNIGMECAKRLKTFGCKIIGVRRHINDKPDIIDEIYALDDIEKILSKCDIVISSLPQYYKTKNILSAKQFELMKEGSYLVNVGRGSFMIRGHSHSIPIRIGRSGPCSYR